MVFLCPYFVSGVTVDFHVQCHDSYLRIEGTKMESTPYHVTIFGHIQNIHIGDDCAQFPLLRF